jgi:broad specificity phosphatase PhoE
VIRGLLIAFAPFFDHGKNVVTFGKLMPDEPASNDRAGSADTRLAVNVNAEANGESSVNVVKDRSHRFNGWNAKVWNFETNDACPPNDGLVVTHEMALRAARTVLRQIDKVANANAKQLLDNVNLIVGCDRMPVGVGAGGKLAGDDPVGAIRWARSHRPDRGLRSSLGQACQP